MSAAWHITLKPSTLTEAQWAAVAGELHDRMLMESVFDALEAAKAVRSPSLTPVTSVDLLGEGRQARHNLRLASVWRWPTTKLTTCRTRLPAWDATERYQLYNARELRALSPQDFNADWMSTANSSRSRCSK